MTRKLVNIIPFSVVLVAAVFQFTVALEYYYTLVEQWLAGCCHARDYVCYTPIPKVFSLHGPVFVTAYFDDALNLLQDTNIMASLSSRNIGPGGTYDAQDYLAALANHNPSIVCENAMLPPGGVFLQEICFCADLSRKGMPYANPSFSTCGGPQGSVQFTSTWV